MEQSISSVLAAMPWILEGAVVTIGTVVFAMLLGLFLGMPMAVGLCYGTVLTRRAIGTYVWIFRGIPILVLLYLIFFGFLDQLRDINFVLAGQEYHFGIEISPFAASCIVLGLTSAAYQSQIFKGAINSIPQGQLKAARALGMRDSKAIRTIILPQALRLSIPGWSNEYSILLKDSALVSVLGTLEIMKRVEIKATPNYEFNAFYLVAALLYFIITFAGVRGLRVLERHLRIPGYSAGH